MNNDMIMLILRLLAGASLLTFMAMIAYYLHRDYQLAAENTRARSEIRGRLVVIASTVKRPTYGDSLPLTSSTTLGRAPTNTIQIDDNYASNEHARVIWRWGQWWLEDQRSSNGTRLNGIPVEEPVILSAGDVIGIGSVQMRLELD